MSTTPKKTHIPEQYHRTLQLHLNRIWNSIYRIRPILTECGRDGLKVSTDDFEIVLKYKKGVKNELGK
jgi:hypothetical protein